MANDIKILEKALQREKGARKQAEKILEDKSRELYLLTQELKATNEKLKDLVGNKESTLQGVFDNLVDAYVLIDVLGNVQEMNHAAKKLFGYDISNEKLNVTQLVYKDDYTYAMESFRELMKNGSFSDYQARVYTKDRGVRMVHINASLIFDKSKKAIAVHGIVRDITDELEHKREYDEQQRKLSIIVENSSLGIALTQYGKILQTNKAFQNLLGYSKEELAEMAVKDISLKEEYAISRDNMKRLNEGEIDHFKINKRYVRKDGSHLWARTSVAAVRDDNKNIMYQVALVEDITEHLKLEKQKDELLKNLKQSNKELNDYAHIVSHDLKSPLRSMNALINWLIEDYNGEMDGSVQKSFDLLLKKVDKMDHLINGVLKYSSVDKLDVQEQLIDLQELVHDIIDVIHIPDHIEVKITDRLPTIKGDKFRLQQLFQNFLSNAIKYNDKEKGEVKVSCKNKKEYWEFSIADNGQGIPKKYHEKIFQIFQTLDDRKESTGVGLSIVKKIIDKYDGEIWVESEEGKGSTFYFTLKKN